MVLTPWLVVSVILNFFMAHIRVALRSLLGGTGMLASWLAGFSMMTEILGIPARLDLDRSWNRSCNISSSSSSKCLQW
jgi:hypothetical protein